MDVKQSDALDRTEPIDYTTLLSDFERTIDACKQLITLCLGYLETFKDLLSENMSESDDQELEQLNDYDSDDY